MPTEAFATAWRADSIPYAEIAYRMWSDFRRLRRVDPLEALQACLPDAVAWLEHGRPERVAPGSLGGADAAIALAEMVDEGLAPDQRGSLIADVAAGALLRELAPTYKALAEALRA